MCKDQARKKKMVAGGYEDSLEVRNLREDRGFRANRVPNFVIFGQAKFSFLSKTKLKLGDGEEDIERCTEEDRECGEKRFCFC